MTKRSFTRFLFTFICVFALACVLMPGPAKADSVTYITRSWNRSAVNSTEATRNDVIPFPESQEIAPGWYYVNRNLTINGRVCLQGDTQIILGDGCTLDVKGLYIPKGYTLHIYGQSEDSGKIYSHPSGGAGIGGYSGHDNGNIVIYGGTIEATGYDHCAGIGSNDGKTGGAITIYGGEITATGGSDGAGIGGGRNCSGGTITIYGGDITAHGGSENGAGIGGGDSGDGGTIVIWGGTITANEDPNENGAGIGGGDCGNGGTITIHGGTFTLYSRDGAGIGGGDDGAGGTITIYGGDITSTKVNQGQGARIGGGADAAPGTITIHGGTITTVSGKGAGIGGGKGNTAGGSVTIDGGVINAGGSYGIGSGQDGEEVAITLGWTEAAVDTISITASSYGGPVTVEQTFKADTAMINPGVMTDAGRLAGRTLVALPGEITSWRFLQQAVNNAQEGEVITLPQDIVADSGNTAIVVPAGKAITLDLNGFTLDRAMTEAAADGCVIRNEGTLTITDSGNGDTAGTIRGGRNTGNGGGICNSGTIYLQGGTIEGNEAANGAGIYNTGTMTMTGGVVTRNEAGTSGGGIYVSEEAELYVSGAPAVENNMKGETASNISLDGSAVIRVTGQLTEGAKLGVTRTEGAGAITGGYGANNTAHPMNCFFADDENGRIYLKSREASLTYPRIVTDWEELRTALAQGGEVDVANDITAGANDSALTVGNRATLELRGHTVDATALPCPSGYGVYRTSMTVGYDFTLTDCVGGGVFKGGGDGFTDVIVVADGEDFTMNGGTIIGTGDDLSDVVYVDSSGTFVMNGGTITAEQSCGWEKYSRVLVGWQASFTMNGGTVSGSGALADVCALSGRIKLRGGTLSGTGQEKGNVYAEETDYSMMCRIYVSGSPYLTGGVYLTSGRTITVDGTLGADAHIPVITEKRPLFDEPVTITDGLAKGGEGAVSRFTGADEELYVALKDNGEAELRAPLSDWEALQQLVDAAADGDEIILEQDYTARDFNHYLEIYSKTVTIDLNGHTINGSALTDDYAIKLKYSGCLTLRDGTGGGAVLGRDGLCVITTDSTYSELRLESGTISGDNCTYTVYIYDGSFVMNGGTVTASGENSSSCIYINEISNYYSSFTLTGGFIDAGQTGTGIAVESIGDYCYLQGSPVVAGYVMPDKPIEITGPIDPDVRISILSTSVLRNSYDNVITSGLAGKGSAENFCSADDEYVVVLKEDDEYAGEAALWKPSGFGDPDFVIPNNTMRIEDNAFEGIAATAVEIPEYCTRIGDRAFKDCTQLTMIRIPADCELGTDVFDGCTKVYVFSTAGSPAEAYCNDPAHGNCVFVKEGN